MRTSLFVGSFVSVVLCSAAAGAATLEVGPGKTYSKPCDAIAAASAGDTIAIQPGTYTDSCAVSKANLTIKGVGGRPKIDLSGTDHPANYKGIYVIDADGVTIDNLELTGANISCTNGANAAGVRIEAKNTTIRNSFLHDNQNGILGGGGTTTVEYTEFARNGLGPGCSCGGCTHNLYVGQGGGKLVFRYNYSHSIATDGHLLKSRCDEVEIAYNRFSGEEGHDSYSIDLPNGGLAIIVGNVIQKGTMPGNKTLLNWGEEGVTKTDKRVFVVNNTFVNDFGSGTFINIAGGGTLTAHNNLFVGAGTISSTGMLSLDNLSGVDPIFVDKSKYDYHLKSGSPAIDKGVDPGSADAFSLTPIAQYVHPTAGEARSIVGAKIDVGAFEFGVVPGMDAGTTPSDSGTTSGDSGTPSTDDSGTPVDDSGLPIGDDASTPGDDGGNGATPGAGTDSSGGCSCSTPASRGSDGRWMLVAAAAALVMTRRRR